MSLLFLQQQYRCNFARRLQGGAFGRIALMQQEGCRHAAIKVGTGHLGREYLEEEITALTAVQGHPHVITLLDTKLVNGERIAVLQYYTHNLHTELTDHGGYYEEGEIRIIGRQAASALQHMDSLGWANGDLKTTNILCVNRLHVELCDYGSARHVTDRRGPHPAYSPYFAAPERTRILISKSDIYSLCVTLLCVAGIHRPEDGNPLVFEEVRDELEEHNSQEFRDAIKQGMELDHIKRPSAAEFAKLKFFNQKATRNKVVKIKSRNKGWWRRFETLGTVAAESWLEDGTSNATLTCSRKSSAYPLNPRATFKGSAVFVHHALDDPRKVYLFKRKERGSNVYRCQKCSKYTIEVKDCSSTSDPSHQCPYYNWTDVEDRFAPLVVREGTSLEDEEFEDAVPAT